MVSISIPKNFTGKNPKNFNEQWLNLFINFRIAASSILFFPIKKKKSLIFQQLVKFNIKKLRNQLVFENSAYDFCGFHLHFLESTHSCGNQDNYLFSLVAESATKQLCWKNQRYKKLYAESTEFNNLTLRTKKVDYIEKEIEL